MFTGIIETTGIIEQITINKRNKTFWIASPLANELKVDQSLSHNGVCLTVEEVKETRHRVTAIEETLLKTNLGKWEKGDVINLERCMQLNGRLDGHIVQGHVDCTARCIDIADKAGSWEFRFAFDKKFSAFIIEKGSVTLNGISLTCFNITDTGFSVAIIPYTFNHTNIGSIRKDDLVNIEWDMIGKYVNRISNLKNP